MTSTTEAASQLVDDVRSGSTLAGRYALGEVIGRGGMGSVYRATRIDDGHGVAIKLLREARVGDRRARRRLRREAEAIAAINHPNVVQLIELLELPAEPGGAEGAVGLVMELLPGQTLSARLRAKAPLPVVAALDIAGQLLRGLAAVHQAGVVHRDVKPSNIVLIERRSGLGPLVKLLDFGIARPEGAEPLTATGEILGTPRCLAPEQASALPASPASDVYAVGCVLYEMLTGRPVFDDPDRRRVCLAHVFDPPPTLWPTLPATLPPTLPPRLPPRPPTDGEPLPPWLCQLVLSWLAKDPAARPVDGAAALAQLIAASQTRRASPPVAAAREAGGADLATVRPPRVDSAVTIPVLTIVHHPDPALVGRRRILAEHEPVVIGRQSRDFGPDAFSRQRRMSRRHLSVQVRGGVVAVEDLGSRAGTTVNGEPVAGSRTLALGDVIAVDDVLFLHHRAAPRAQRVVDPVFVGSSPALARMLSQLAAAAKAPGPAWVVGQPGAGRSLVATELHRRANAEGPLRVVSPEAAPPVLSGLHPALTLVVDEVIEPLSEGWRSAAAAHHRSVFICRPRAAAALLCDAPFLETARRIDVPSLSERIQDVLPLARYFRGAALHSSSEALALLLRPWPGNVRELREVVGGSGG